MKLVGACGPSNPAQSPAVDAERTVNLFQERRDAGDPKSPMWLYATPGLATMSDGGDLPASGCFQQNGRAFFVSGLAFRELLADGTVVDRGSVASSSTPATIISNGSGGNQLMVVVGRYGYTFNLDSNTLSFITDLDFPQGQASMCAFVDGYALVLVIDSGIFQWSANNDFTSWDALDFAETSQTSDWIQSLFVDVDRKVVWAIKEQNAELYYDSGDTLQPFIPVPNALISEGSAAPFGYALVDNAVLWIGQSTNGSRHVMEGSGTSAHRVSTRAVEQVWALFSTVADAIGWTMEYRGHSWAVFTFPTANTTWVYDRTEQAWFEWLYWDATTGAYQAHLVRCHMYAFDMHLGGSRLDGTLYEISGEYYDDNGAPIRRLRRFPHVVEEEEFIFCSKLQHLMQVGAGLSASSTTVGANPLFMQRISRNGGRTFGNARTTAIGKIGEYLKRVLFWRNGRFRDGVIEFTFTDPTICAYVGCNGDFDQGVS